MSIWPPSLHCRTLEHTKGKARATYIKRGKKCTWGSDTFDWITANLTRFCASAEMCCLQLQLWGENHLKREVWFPLLKSRLSLRVHNTPWAHPDMDAHIQLLLLSWGTLTHYSSKPQISVSGAAIVHWALYRTPPLIDPFIYPMLHSYIAVTLFNCDFGNMWPYWCFMYVKFWSQILSFFRWFFALSLYAS